MHMRRQTPAIPSGRRPSPVTRLVLERTPYDRWVCTEFALAFTLFRARVDGAWQEIPSAPPRQWITAGRETEWAGVYYPAMNQGLTATAATSLADAIGRLLQSDAAFRTGRDPLPSARYVGYMADDDETLTAFALFLRRGACTVVELDDPFVGLPGYDPTAPEWAKVSDDDSTDVRPW